MVPEMESMFERAKRGDCEGLFRWHWVLIDSLEIFFDIMHHPYFGPKKTLKWMEEKHPESFDCYRKALQNLDMECLEEWVVHFLLRYKFLHILKKLDGVVLQVGILMIVLFAEIAWVQVEYNAMKKKMIKKKK